jgi:G3E family GTPase
VVGELADPQTGTTLREVVCVVDASHFWTDLWSSDFVPVAQDRVIAVGAARLHGATGSGAAQTDPETASALVGRAELLISQIEFASVLVLVNAGSMTAEDRALLVGLLGHLNPQARVEARGAGSPDPAAASATDPVVRAAFAQEQTAPGWVALLNDEFAPRLEHAGITALRYVQMRPFHPDRLWRCLTRMLTDDGAGRLVRSVGFCHVATRPHVTAQWDHVGGMLSLTPAQHDRALTAHEEPLAFGQDLALIGIGPDPEAVRAELDTALLTDDELLAGPRAWARYRDPLPTWAGEHG